MSHLSYEQRRADPRWAEAGNLFDAQLGQQPYWGRLSSHARDNIRYAVQAAAIGLGSTFGGPDATLERVVEKYVRMDEAGVGLLAQCRSIARSAARAGTQGQETAHE